MVAQPHLSAEGKFSEFCGPGVVTFMVKDPNASGEGFSLPKGTPRSTNKAEFFDQFNIGVALPSLAGDLIKGAPGGVIRNPDDFAPVTTTQPVAQAPQSNQNQPPRQAQSQRFANNM